LKNKVLGFFQKPFIRNVLVMTSGTLMAQIINMIFSPLITRVYGPEAYGLMGTFTAIVQIVAPVAALTYPIATVLPKKDDDSKIISRISLTITVINTIIVSVILLLFGNNIVDLFNIGTISAYMLFVPFVLLCAGILQIFEQRLIRKQEFQVSAIATSLEALLVNGGKLTVGLAYPVAGVLIFFTAFRQGIRALIMTLFTKKINIKELFARKYRKKEMTDLAREYKNFPMYRAPEVFFNAVSGNLPMLLLNTFFGPASVGFYSISRTVLTIPSKLVGKSVGDVFYPRATKAANSNEKITPLLVKATSYLGMFAIIPYGLVILIGPWLFGFVFGQDWVVAGEYARWVSIWMFFGFINRPCVQTLPILSAQRFQLIFTICTMILRIIALLVGFYFFRDDMIAIALFSIVGALSNIYLITATILKTRKFDDDRNSTPPQDLL